MSNSSGEAFSNFAENPVGSSSGILNLSEFAREVDKSQSSGNPKVFD